MLRELCELLLRTYRSNPKLHYYWAAKHGVCFSRLLDLDLIQSKRSWILWTKVCNHGQTDTCSWCKLCTIQKVVLFLDFRKCSYFRQLVYKSRLTMERKTYNMEFSLWNWYRMFIRFNGKFTKIQMERSDLEILPDIEMFLPYSITNRTTQVLQWNGFTFVKI